MVSLPLMSVDEIIRMHLDVIISPRRANNRVGPELNLATMQQLNDNKITHRL